MTTLVNNLIGTYNYYVHDMADPRVTDFFLLSSPIPITLLSLLYLYITTSFGPRYMKDREPYNLKNTVFVYNVFQVLMSAFLFYEGSFYLSSGKFSFTCTPVDYSNDPVSLRVAAGAWWYFISKIIEYLDTIFFVFRKKGNQITFLHVYHHSLMAFTMWIGAKYYAGGHGILMGTLNAFVHIIMYTYYLIAGLGPKYEKYIWWKKHVTVLQLIQFVIVLIHNLTTLFSDCSYPKYINVLMSLNALVFINLFGRFFYASYIKGKSEDSKKGSTKNGTNNNGTTKNGAVTIGTATNKTRNGHSHLSNENIIENSIEKIARNGKHKDI